VPKFEVGAINLDDKLPDIRTSHQTSVLAQDLGQKTFISQIGKLNHPQRASPMGGTEFRNSFDKRIMLETDRMVTPAKKHESIFDKKKGYFSPKVFLSPQA
jgi:hypothetical protein